MLKRMSTFKIAEKWDDYYYDMPMAWVFRADRDKHLLAVIHFLNGTSSRLFSGSADCMLPVANWSVVACMLDRHERDKDKVELAFFHKAERQPSVSTFVLKPEHSFDFPHRGETLRRIPTKGKKLILSTNQELLQLP